MAARPAKRHLGLDQPQEGDLPSLTSNAAQRQKMKPVSQPVGTVRPFDHIPNEILSIILSHLDTRDRVACSRVCRRFLHVSRSPEPGNYMAIQYPTVAPSAVSGKKAANWDAWERGMAVWAQAVGSVTFRIGGGFFAGSSKYAELYVGFLMLSKNVHSVHVRLVGAIREVGLVADFLNMIGSRTTTLFVEHYDPDVDTANVLGTAIGNCTKLRHFSVGAEGHPLLQRLRLEHCHDLQTVDIYHEKYGPITVIPVLPTARSLKAMCPDELMGLKHWTNLRKIHLDLRKNHTNDSVSVSMLAACQNLTSLTLLASARKSYTPKLQNAKAVKTQSFQHLQSLTIAGFEGFPPSIFFSPSLTYLDLGFVPGTKIDLSPIANCKNLRSLTLRASLSDRPTSGFGPTEDFDLVCANCSQIEHLTINGLVVPDIDGISELRDLKSLRLKDVRVRPAHLQEISFCSSILDLWLEGCEGLDDITAIEEFEDLRELHLSSLDITTLRLPSTPTLHRLCISECDELEDISAVRECPSLHSVDLKYCKSLWNIEPLEECPSLQRLQLKEVGVCDLSFLASCPLLTVLSATRLPNLSTLGPNPWENTHLHTVTIKGCYELSSADALSGCVGLAHLTIDGCDALKSLAALGLCGQLDSLKLSDIPALTEAPEGWLPALAGIKGAWEKGEKEEYGVVVRKV